MPKRRTSGICPIDGCINRIWGSRNLPVCGDHAGEILHLLDREVAARVRTHADREARHFRAVIRHQQKRIQELENGGPAKATPSANGVVYYLRSGAYIKIGWTSDLEKRMRAYAPDSLLLAVEPGTRKDEQRRHRMFAAHRTHGREWYAMVPSLLHHIDQTTRQHGTPDAVTFAARPVEIPQPRTPEPVTPRGWTGRRVS